MNDAYIEGFCKTAEEHEVDPETLLKEASLASMMRGYLATGSALAAKHKDVQNALQRIQSLGSRVGRVRDSRRALFDVLHSKGRAVFDAHYKNDMLRSTYDKRMLYKEILSNVKDINKQFGTRIRPQDVKNFWSSGFQSDGINKLRGMESQAASALLHHYIAGGTAASAAAGVGVGGAYALGRGIGALHSSGAKTPDTP